MMTNDSLDRMFYATLKTGGFSKGMAARVPLI